MYTKQDLASLGKRVSNEFINHGTPLNDAIIKLASTRPDMTKEHVQRVIENANLITFEEMFKGSSNKHVTFDLADPNEIHEQMNQEKAQDIDPIYLTEPQREYDISGWQPEVKVASVVPKNVQWRRDYYATKGAVEHLVKEANTASAKAEAMTHNFIHMVKRAAHVNGIKPILQLAGYASKDRSVFEKIAQATTEALPQMVKEGSYVESVPNKEHPIYKQYEQLERQIKVAHKIKSALINAERYHQSVISENYL